MSMQSAWLRQVLRAGRAKRAQGAVASNSGGWVRVGVCVDGMGVPELDAARCAGAVPSLERLEREASTLAALATGAFPSLTNTNLAGMITGCSPVEHGISGNYFFDTSRRDERMMNDATDLRAPSKLAQFQSAFDADVFVVTTKRKLLPMLSSGLPYQSVETTQFDSEERIACCIAVEGSGTGIASWMGKVVPDIYDPLASIYSLQIGRRLILERLENRKNHERPIVAFLATTDFVQHSFAPNSEVALDFMSKVDTAVFSDDGLHGIDKIAPTSLVVTADHGMNEKTEIIFLAPLLQERFPQVQVRIVLPITDPHIRHHNALGGFASIYLEDDAEMALVIEIMTFLRSQQGIYTVIGRKDASRELELPEDRIGDIVVIAQQFSALGASPMHHFPSTDGVKPNDLIIRTHGGLHETTVPLITTQPMRPSYLQKITSGKARNFHMLDLLLNGVNVEEQMLLRQSNNLNADRI